MSAGRFAAIGHALAPRIARARGLAAHRAPPLPGLDFRLAFVDAETFIATPWPGDRSGHVSPEWDIAGPDVAVTASPRASLATLP